MIHPHGKGITLKELQNVRMLPPKDAGRYWNGFAHHALVISIIDEAESRGWEVTDLRIVVSRKGADMDAGFSIHIPKLAAPLGFDFAFGLSTSNSRHKRSRFYSGLWNRRHHYAICLGDVSVSKRHTVNTLYSKEVARALDCFLDQVLLASRYVRKMQAERTVQPATAAAYLYAHGAITWPRVRHLIGKMNTDRFTTKWGLLAAAGAVIARCPVTQQLRQLLAVRRIVEAYPEDMRCPSPA